MKKQRRYLNPSISQLPDELLDLIVTFLPIKEAAKTSILSTEWRHRWKCIRRLVFDGNFAPFKSGSDSGSRFRSESDSRKVMSHVSQAVASHDGPINKFQLSIPGMDDCPYFDSFFNFVTTTKSQSVNELVLEFDTYKPLPATFFDFHNLSSLKLHRCGFGFQYMSLPLSMGFSKLTSVVLNDVLLCMDFFEIFLPQCPLLQELNLFDCCIADSEPPSLEPLLFPSSLRSISITFSIWLPRHNGFFFGKFQPDMVALFASLPALEQLNLDLGFLLFLSGSNNVPYQLPALVHNLTILKIPHILLGRLKESSVLACLIKSSPNLRKLTIGLNHEDQFRREFADEYDPDRISDDLLGDGLHKLLEPEDYRRVCCLQHLEELNISNMCGNRVELELVRFVLANAPVLKRVFITPRNDLCSDTMSKFVVEVAQCTRISKEAEVHQI